MLRFKEFNEAEITWDDSKHPEHGNFEKGKGSAGGRSGYNSHYRYKSKSGHTLGIHEHSAVLSHGAKENHVTVFHSEPDSMMAKTHFSGPKSKAVEFIKTKYGIDYKGRPSQEELDRKHKQKHRWDY